MCYNCCGVRHDAGRTVLTGILRRANACNKNKSERECVCVSLCARECEKEISSMHACTLQ